ncbi:MAG: ABC transporter permease [Calditrichales bacterium]|nr:ABC transporter permease [Calditrichales bacterium]
MFKNYFKIAIRNLIKNKIYSFVSIFGLAIGMAVCILLLLYVQHELSYDRFHKNADHIYRLCNPDHPYHSPQTAKLLADNFPEIKNYTRILVQGEQIIQHKEKRFKETEFVYADAGLFQIFSFKFKHGNPETALQKPFTIVISEKIARKYFGDENPIGKVFKLNNEYDYSITGVMEDMPQNSHFRYDFFATLTNAENVFGANRMNHWGWENFLVYFLIQDEISKSTFETKCNELMAKLKNVEPNNPLPKYSIQQLKEIHLYSQHFENDIQPQNSITYVLVFSAIGMLILLIACLNYINIVTANASTRANEIGIKKVVGATRKQLAKQFIGESFVVIFMAVSLSVIIVEICLPIFNMLSGKVLSSSALFQMNTILGILGIILITGILAGCYPAFFLSAFQPVRLLKTSDTGGKSKFHFRRILVGTQFTIVIILICSAILMFRQINFLQQKKLGFNKEYTLISEVNSFKEVEKYNTLKQALLEQSLVTSVSCASRVPSDDLNNWGSLTPEGQTDAIVMPFVHMSFDYFETLGITAKQGRLFSNELTTDINEALILNEAAVNKIGIHENPVGQSVLCNWPKSDRKIIGIVNDFHFESLYEQIRPAAFVMHHPMCWKLMVKVKPSNAISSINTIKEICQNFYPDWIFEFHFLDDRLENIYQADKKTFQLMGYFTMLAIFIACMGLFGMASFMIKQRTKEIGVRKALGASIAHILITLTKDFTKWVIWANIFAWPVAYYAMNKWLENFAYKIEIGWWVFILAGGIALIIALLTVSCQAIMAATANPVESLRYE